MRIKIIRVLIIDDSLFFRNIILKGLEGEERIEIVGMAGDPFEARDKILELEPDVITLDIEMPQMDGIEFLQRLMPQYPIPALVVSVHGERMLMALEAGAVDFIQKPFRMDKDILNLFIQDLIVKIKIASMANVSAYKSRYFSQLSEGKKAERAERLIAIGASTGGTEAVCEIIKELPGNMPGIVVVQHMPEGFTKMYADRLNQTCRMEVKEAENGDLVLPGRVLIAAGGYQTKVCKDSRRYYVKCYKGEPVNGHRPSVDVLFYSAAEAAGANATGVILTGMGYDGAKGLLAMRKNGGFTIGQDEKSCVVYGMPKVAFDIGGVMEQISIDMIARKLYTLTHL